MDAKLNHIPAWARSKVSNLSKLAKGKGPVLEGLSERKVPDLQVIDHLNRNREIFAENHHDDENPERDHALGEKGHIKNDGIDIWYEGNAAQGQVSIVRDDSVAYIELNGTESTRIDLNKDGTTFVTKADLKKTGDGKTWGNHFENRSLNIPESEFAGSTASAAELLKEQPADSLFRQVFLDHSKSMPSVRSELMGQVKDLTSGLGQDASKELKNLLEKPDANTPRRLGEMAAKLRQTAPDDKEIKKLAEVAGTWQALEDFPKLMADGLMRNSINYMGPLHLTTQAAAQGWEFDKASGLPIADSVVIGGGPGGLSSAYHLSENGSHTVVLEGGNTGQAFSDSSAASVHQLRTTLEQSNLTYTANANHLGIDVSLTRQRESVPKKAAEARDEWYQATGQAEHGFAPSTDDSTRPANRGELFDHMSMLSQGLAQRYPDTFVIENSPFSSIEVTKGEDGKRLYKVTTEKGHQMMTRSLVLATGFVGTAGEHARTLRQFSNLDQGRGSGVAVIGSDHDLVSKNDRLEKDSLVFSDRLLGRPEIRQRIQDLPKGSRLAVVGGGESAAKGALEALHLNPGLSVDLYTSKALEPYQTQIPTSVISANVVETALTDPEIAQKSMDSLKTFETPIVSSTMKELLEMESAGRVRVRELGKRFDENTVGVSTKSGGGFSLQLKDPESRNSLLAQRESWQEAGLYAVHGPEDAADQLPDADMVMMAAGYDKHSCQAGPLVQQLVDQGAISFENGEVAMGPDGLTSAKDPMIAINTAAVQKNAADSALPGRAIRAFRLGHYFKDKLPDRAQPATTIGKGLYFNQYLDTNSSEERITSDLAQAKQYLANGGLPQALVEYREQTIGAMTDPVDRQFAQNQWEAQKAYPNSADPTRELMQREMEVPETLTPVEHILAQRGRQLRERL